MTKLLTFKSVLELVGIEPACSFICALYLGVCDDTPLRLAKASRKLANARADPALGACPPTPMVGWQQAFDNHDGCATTIFWQLVTY